MKLRRVGEKGLEKPPPVVTHGQWPDLSRVVDDIAGNVLTPEGLKRLQAVDLESLPIIKGMLRIGACVGQVVKFICIGLNYADHAAESGADAPKELVVFNKWIIAIVGPNDDVEIPRNSTKTDWEVELGVVIGKPGRYIDEAEAMQHVRSEEHTSELQSRGHLVCR